MTKVITHKLLSIDLDGTLLTPVFRVVKKADCYAIQDFMEAGGMPFINTGRTPGAVLPIVKKINKFGSHKLSFISCLNGTYIRDFNDNEVVTNTMTHNQAKQILEIVRSLNKKNIYCWFYFPRDFENNIIQSTPNPWWRKAYPFSKVIKLKDESDMTCCKITIFCINHKTIDDAYRKFKEANLNKELKIIHTSKRLIEVMPLGIDKGFALKHYCKKYNIPENQTCSIGDTFNDAPAFNNSHLSIAVKPRNPKLKELVNYTIDKKIKGVSKAIYKYLLTEEGK